MTQFISGKKASKILGVHFHTLYKYEKKWNNRNNPNSMRQKNVQHK